MASWLDRGFSRRRKLRYWIEAPLRRPWHVLLPAALVLVGAVALGLRIPPRYRAAALVAGEWDTAGEAALRSRGIDVAIRRRQDVRQRLLARPALERLVRQPELGARAQLPAPEDTVKWLDVVRVQSQGASAFRIECLWPDATRAALIANLLATDLVELTNDADGPQGSARPSLLGERLEEARRLLEERQTALRRVQPVPVAPRPEETEDVLQPTEQIEAERRAVAAVLATARARASRLEETIASEGRTPGSTAVGPEAELERARRDLVELRKRYTEEHPDVERLARRVRRLEDAVALQGAPPPRRELQEVEAEIAALTLRLAELEAAARRSSQPTRPTSKPSSPPQRDVERLADELAEARRAYEALLAQWQAAETAARLGRAQTVRFELLRSAVVPDRPESAGLWLFALAGSALGLVLGLAAALLAEMRDATIKGPEDLAHILQAPLLATVPLVRTRRQRQSG